MTLLTVNRLYVKKHLCKITPLLKLSYFNMHSNETSHFEGLTCMKIHNKNINYSLYIRNPEKGSFTMLLIVKEFVKVNKLNSLIRVFVKVSNSQDNS